MEERLRQHIKQNINKLVSYTDYRKLMDACRIANLLTLEMELYIEKTDRNAGDFERERHKRLFVELTRRGPTAYKRIIEILKRLGYEKASEILEYPGDNENDYVPRTNQQRITQSSPPQNNPPHNSNLHTNSIAAVNDENENNVEFAEYTLEIPEEYKFEVKKSTKIHESFDPASYPAKTNKRGVLLIVNIIDVKGLEDQRRDGSEYDKFKLVHLYREIGFKVYAYDNLTRKQFENIMEKVTTSDVAGEAEIFQLVLMTHGENQNKTQMCSFSDGSVMKEEEILSYLQNSKCHNLYGKPKICIFQFCRGSQLEHPQRVQRLQHDSMKTPKMIEPTYTDLLICYTTLPGFLSNREPERGAWYIQNFCDIMAKSAHNQHFEEIVKKTNEMTTKQRGEEDNRMQTPNFMNYGFNRNLYMNPGFYENMNSS